MKLFNAPQIKEWDQHTILNEPVSSIDLMERAATACTDWICKHAPYQECYIFCANGNNGGDGLAIGRQLVLAGRRVHIFIAGDPNNATKDFTLNLDRLKKIPLVSIMYLKSNEDFNISPSPSAIVIDALFGTGLNRPVGGYTGEIVDYINHLPNKVIAIDMPTGLHADMHSPGPHIIQADYTLTFETLKLALLMPGNARYFGQVFVLNIGLHPSYPATTESKYELADKHLLSSIFKPRGQYAHKGDFGHALLIAGSYGKMGAAVLSTRACLRSGVGLTTVHVPQKGVTIMQTSAPEAMCQSDPDPAAITQIDYALTGYSSIGIGPGIGTIPPTKDMIYFVISHFNKPMVIDADALNILSENKSWLDKIPENSIITPHPKEFARLFGEQENDFKRIETAMEQAVSLRIIIVLKGHRTFIATPAGKGYFNTSGNAGMATGGSGDVLTGILTGLLAQRYSPVEAALMAVYLHGLAGDKAAAIYGMEPMKAGDLIENLRFTGFSQTDI